ncbi:hypothetical protein R6Q57_002251 [Mikania cordata]
MTCGHQLWTSCGLPCACHISKYINTDTKIPLSLCGQHMEMSIERFVVHLGIYYEPETVHDAFTQGLTQGENGVMRA